MDREKQRELDMKQSELDKLQVEMKVYKDLIEVRNLVIFVTSIKRFYLSFDKS